MYLGWQHNEPDFFFHSNFSINVPHLIDSDLFSFLYLRHLIIPISCNPSDDYHKKKMCILYIDLSKTQEWGTSLCCASAQHLITNLDTLFSCFGELDQILHRFWSLVMCHVFDFALRKTWISEVMSSSLRRWNSTPWEPLQLMESAWYHLQEITLQQQLESLPVWR